MRSGKGKGKTAIPLSFDREETCAYIGVGHSESGIIRGKTMERKQYFDDNGYLTAEGVFTEEEMDDLMRRVGALEGRHTPFSRE